MVASVDPPAMKGVRFRHRIAGTSASAPASVLVISSPTLSSDERPLPGVMPEWTTKADRDGE